MKKIIIIIISITLIQKMSFAIGSKNTMNKIMDSWMGENIETVINYWGYPSAEKIIAGKKLYYWVDSNYVITGNVYGTYGRNATCNRILEVDKNNKVIKGQWSGNNCPAIYFTGKKFVNQKNNPWRKE